MSKIGKMSGRNLLSDEIDFRTSSGASTSTQFDEDFAPAIYAGAAYLKGLYITEWTAAKLDGGIKIQNGTSTTQSSNTDLTTLDLSNATTPGDMAKAFSFSSAIQITDGLHIAATADFGGNSIVKVRLLYEPVGGAGAAAIVNAAKAAQPDTLISSEIAFTDGASTSVQFDESYSVKIEDVPVLLHTIIITEWVAAAQIDGGIRIQDGTSTAVGDNTDIINLDLSNKSTTENMAKNFDFPGGIFLGSGLHIATTADLGSSNVFKFQALYEII